MESATAQPSPETTQSPEQAARNYRSFILIWVAQLVARIGNGLTAFGLGVYVYQLNGQSTSVAMVTMAAFLPGVLLAPLGGVLADRIDRRLLMILGDGLSAVGLVVLLLLIQAGIGNVAIVCICVAISSVFTSVMDPAYRATISDLLTPEQYARASGMVQFASAAQYLVSPAVAGVLMYTFDISLVLLIDVGTMAVTTLSMVLVWRTIKSTKPAAETGFWDDLRSGIAFLSRNSGITVLMLLVTFVTFCMGFLQTLLTPMVLDLSNEEVLGVVRSVAAVGMIVASLAIGIFSMGYRHIRYISIALAASGVVTLAMGSTVNVLLIGVFCFLFFMTLPPLNTSVEVLVRASIPNETQGKVWGLMGLISQVGYIIAYGVSGVLADYVFNPLLVPGGALADSVGGVIGVGTSRGIGLMLIIVGVLMVGIAFVMPRVKSIRVLEETLKNQL